MTLSTPLFCDEKPEPKKPTGCEVGAEMPAFYVRDVNGARPNLAVCLVCQNGARPVVMIAVRKIDQQVERLLQAVDRLVDSQRAEGLRGFTIFLAPDAKELKELQPRLVTLARDRSLSLPLTIPVESATGPASLGLPDDLQTTVLFYVEKKIVSRHFFRADELTDGKIDQVTKDAKHMLPNGAASFRKPEDTAN
jgi:hypothetical protein